MKKVAVILCGSGFKDGSEIRESVGVLWALSEAGAETEIFALNSAQADVVNCLTLEAVAGETRNQLVEAARIARGKISPLEKLDVTQFDAVILPGGFGAAKNWCTFATQGSQGKVNPQIQKTLQAFYAARKPIGAVCIAPAVVAMAFPGRGFELTVGDNSEASQEIEKLGHRHVVKKANEYHIDNENRIVTTPAYMYDAAPLHEIFAGIRGLVRRVLE